MPAIKTFPFLWWVFLGLSACVTLSLGSYHFLSGEGCLFVIAGRQFFSAPPLCMHQKILVPLWYTLPTDQLFNLEFQFKSVFNLEIQPKFGIQLGIPV